MLDETAGAVAADIDPSTGTPAAPARTGRRRLALAAAIAGVVLAVLGESLLSGGVGAVIVLLGVAALVGGVLKLLLLRFSRGAADAGFWLAAIWLGVLVVLASLVSVLPLPEGRDPANALNTQALLSPDLLSTHPLGTDTQGLDILTELLYGARVSLIVAVGGVLIGAVLGGLIGLIAGFRLGKTDAAVGFVTDVVLSFPALILLLSLVTVLTPNVINVTIALGVLAVPGYIRLARANTIKVASRDFVVAAKTLGAKDNRVMLREVMPNVAPSLFAYSFIVIGFLIVAEASLSFLGLGIQRPNPTWGNVIAQGQPYIDQHPSLVVAPAVLLFLTVVSMNYIGQRLQTKWGL